MACIRTLAIVNCTRNRGLLSSGVVIARPEYNTILHTALQYQSKHRSEVVRTKDRTYFAFIHQAMISSCRHYRVYWSCHNETIDTSVIQCMKNQVLWQGGQHRTKLWCIFSRSSSTHNADNSRVTHGLGKLSVCQWLPITLAQEGVAEISNMYISHTTFKSTSWLSK